MFSYFSKEQLHENDNNYIPRTCNELQLKIGVSSICWRSRPGVQTIMLVFWILSCSCFTSCERKVNKGFWSFEWNWKYPWKTLSEQKRKLINSTHSSHKVGNRKNNIIYVLNSFPIDEPWNWCHQRLVGVPQKYQAQQGGSMTALCVGTGHASRHQPVPSNWRNFCEETYLTQYLPWTTSHKRQEGTGVESTK